MFLSWDRLCQLPTEEVCRTPPALESVAITCLMTRPGASGICSMLSRFI
jgi:hypothetical protein